MKYFKRKALYKPSGIIFIRRILTGLIMTGLIFTISNSRASEVTRAFLDGISQYKTGKYAAAIKKLSFVSENGIENPDLYYNLGNAYLKNGELGYAVLWYERAAQLIPNDADLKFNLDYARSQVKDIKEDRKKSVIKILFFWKHLLNAPTIQWMAIILNAVFWLLLVIRFMANKKPSKMFCWFSVILALVFIMTALYNYYEEKHFKQAVIISDSVSVRSGLAEDSTELFILHEGTKVDVKKERNGYYRIYFSKGKIGWLKKSQVEVI